MDSVEPDPYRVRKRNAKCVVLADGQQLAKPAARISESRNGVSDGWDQRFLPDILLNDVIAVQPVLLPQFDIDVSRSLVERDVGDSTAGKTGEIRLRRRRVRRLVEVGCWD